MIYGNVDSAVVVTRDGEGGYNVILQQTDHEGLAFGEADAAIEGIIRELREAREALRLNPLQLNPLPGGVMIPVTPARKAAAVSNAMLNLRGWLAGGEGPSLDRVQDTLDILTGAGWADPA